MPQQTNLQCRCAAVRITVTGDAIASVECLCNSCVTAGRALATLKDAPAVLDSKDATGFVMYRKDRVNFDAGSDALKAFRLSPDAGTQRVVASCCNTPMFLELKGGHWLSLYAGLWPERDRPAVEFRTMAGDRTDLPDDVPNLKTHSLSFYGRLFWAWVQMGFRNPRIEVKGDVDVVR
jgi:hypothetical protein